MKGRSKRPFPNQIRPLVERFDVCDGAFILVPLSDRKKRSEIDSLFRTTSSGTQPAHTEFRIDNLNKGETMDTLLIVIIVLFLLGGGGWGYSRWRR